MRRPRRRGGCGFGSLIGGYVRSTCNPLSHFIFLESASVQVVSCNIHTHYHREGGGGGRGRTVNDEGEFVHAGLVFHEFLHRYGVLSLLGEF